MVAEKPKPKVMIRAATAQDTVNLLRLLYAMQNESAIRYPPFDDVHTVQWISRVLESGYAGVATYSDRLVGSWAMMSVPFSWNRNFSRATTQWLFVHPKFRKGGTARGLLQHGVRWANEQNLIPAIGTMMGTNPMMLDRFLRMNGFLYAGGNFVGGHFVSEG